ncbi:uncharacterized protein [Halyomorpha halys]|nr:uncharacterized protein LOC106679699 isoform X2 [Halyomorpha halys]
MITCQTHVISKVSRRMQTNWKVPIGIMKRRGRSFLHHHITLYNGTDNPNREQMLMADAFIKSSNGLFKSEMEVSYDKATGLEDSVGACPSKLGLFKSRLENSAKLDMDSSQDRIVHTGRMRRYLFLDKVGTIRPLNHVRDGRGARRCDHENDINRMCLPKERILRSRQSNLMEELYTNRLYGLPKFKRRLRSLRNGRQIAYNRKYLNRKFNRLKNSLKGRDSGEGQYNISEKMFNLFSLNSDFENLKSMTEKEREKSRNKILRKRSEPLLGECANPMKRSRCSKPPPTVIIQSVNIGRTGRICFPLTHRCIGMRTCPCSVEYRKCPPRTTCCLIPETFCFEQEETTSISTVGRCLGIDTATPTPIEEGLCMVSPCIVQDKVRKRCACECGCGCPNKLRPNHPGRAVAGGGCGCGCGCGCIHGGSCRTRKPLT